MAPGILHRRRRYEDIRGFHRGRPLIDQDAAPGKGERIAKRLSRAGVCSRREAERWIEDGRVAVNGAVIASPATLVDGRSRITVDGRRVAAPEATRLWRHHKPAGVISTTSDPEGRPTVFSRLPADMPRVMLVGRLDIASEGLLLLTNDGATARRLELPATGWIRRYRVRVFGTPDEERLAALESGITIDGIAYGPIRARLDRVQGDNAWLTVALREGRNREVRRVMEHLGLRVNRLIRTAYGPFQLGSLPRDAVSEVPARVVAEQLGDPASGSHAVRAGGEGKMRQHSGTRTAKKPGRKGAGRRADRRR